MEAKSKIINAPVSPKYSREVAVTIKGMTAEKAKKFLEGISEMKTPLILRRFNKEVPHHYGKPSRYPVKVAKQFLKVLENAVANAVYMGADEKDIVIIDAHVSRGQHKRPMGARPLGKSKQHTRRANISITVFQKGEPVKRAKPGKTKTEAKPEEKVEVKAETKAPAAKKTAPKKKVNKQ